VRQPGVGVAAVVVDGERVLVVRRSRAPSAGLWAFPGGRLEWGEALADGARREVREETGLEIGLDGFLDIVEALEPPQDPEHHWVIVEFRARPSGGRLAAGDDAAEARWATLAELAALPLAPRVLALARAALGRADGG
jgi:ADP-ribose pyrophosphatase YjhB (NUDIX family)